jgi:hypothetical protein
MLLTHASHPDPFEANGMPPTYDSMHWMDERTAILSPKGEQDSARKQSRPLLADPLELEGVRSVGAVK